jgi:hypothetical protein
MCCPLYTFVLWKGKIYQFELIAWRLYQHLKLQVDPGSLHGGRKLNLDLFTNHYLSVRPVLLISD